MAQKTIKKSIAISAPGERIWEVLMKEKYTAQWYEAFGEGIHADTDWKVGSKAVFTDQKGSGLAGKIVENKPNQLLTIEYTGVVNAGKEDYESAFAQQVKGGREVYTLTTNGEKIQLAIACDMDADYFDFMSAAWEKALEKIKALAESN